MDTIAFEPSQVSFFAKFDALSTLLNLFNLTSDVYVFIKNTDEKFMWMSRNLCDLHGLKSTGDYFGKTDLDLSPPDLAHGYMEEDRRIMETRKPILNCPWIVINKQGERNWYISTKIPLVGPGNEIVGTAGVMRDCTKTGDVLQPFHEMSEVISHIFSHYSQKIPVEDLATLMFLSVSQFERKFSRIFHATPQQFILKVRLDSAMRMLMETDLSITQISQKTGFYDSSFFTKQFKKMLGLTPREFRLKYVPRLRLSSIRRKKNGNSGKTE